MESQSPKFEVIVNGECVDLVDSTIDIIELVGIIETMIPATRMRLIMTLINRMDEFEEFLSK